MMQQKLKIQIHFQMNIVHYLNNKLVLSVREQINKMPIKISVVSVLLFIPIILLIILSPLIIELIGLSN